MCDKNIYEKKHICITIDVANIIYITCIFYIYIISAYFKTLYKRRISLIRDIVEQNV